MSQSESKSPSHVEGSSTATSPSSQTTDVTSPTKLSNSDMPPPKQINSKRKSSSTTAKPIGKKMEPRSWVWDHMTKYFIPEFKEIEKDGQKVIIETQILKVKCNYCSQVFAHTHTGGTSTLGNHINRSCKKYKPTSDIQQKVLTSSGDHRNTLVSKGFSQEECVQACVKMIVIDELPFNFVEKEGFRYFCNVAVPRMHVPSRRTIVREFLNMYGEMKENLRRDLSKHRVSLTTDTWTSIQNVNYMVVTTHFIDDDWILHKRILNFCVIPSHQGKDIGKLIEKCLVEWKIEKVMCISVDNAAANKVAIDWLAGKMKKWPDSQILLGGKYMHVRCLAHIINLIVKDGLKKMDRSVAAIRNAVKYVKSSPQRFDYFKACVEKEKLETKGCVIMDVPTRWNSTYMMLESALKFRKAFDRMCEEEENSYLGYFNEEEAVDDDELSGKTKHKGRVGPPDETDWANATIFVDFLKAFYLVTLKISASLHPTVHTFVHDILSVEAEIDRLFMHEEYGPGSPMYHKSHKKDMICVLNEMAISMKAKYTKYFGAIKNLNPLCVIALVLDPHFKLRHFLHLCKKKLQFTTEELEAKEAEIKEVLMDLCDAYAPQQQGNNLKKVSVSQSSDEQQITSRLPPKTENPSTIDDMMDEWDKELEETNSNVVAHEMDRYFLDPIEKRVDKAVKFDILLWWKNNGSKYPTLAKIAKDVLAIQVSTVASESAFSTRGRVIDAFRSSLTPKSVEALICLQNWLRSEKISIIEYEANVEELKFYEECEKEYATKAAFDGSMEYSQTSSKKSKLK